MNAKDQADVRDELLIHRGENLIALRKIGELVQPLLPSGWSGKITLVVDNGVLKVGHSAIEYRMKT